MRGEPGSLTEKPNEAKLSDAGGRGEFVKANVAFGAVGEVLVSEPNGPVIVCAAPGRQRAAGRKAGDHCAEPFREPLVAFQPDGRRV